MSNYRLDKKVAGYHSPEASANAPSRGVMVVQAAKPSQIHIRPSAPSPQTATLSGGYTVNRPAVITHNIGRHPSWSSETSVKQAVPHHSPDHHSSPSHVPLQPSSPGPPPYSLPVEHVKTHSSPQRITVSPHNLAQMQATHREPVYTNTAPAYRSHVTVEPKHQRSQSPYQDRRDVEMSLPSYTASYTKYPEGVPSRIVYTTKSNAANQGQVQSRPLNQSEPPQSQVQTRTSNQSEHPQSPASPPNAKSPPPASPWSYQLKPTMDTVGSGEEASPTKDSGGQGLYPKEDEVDALTDLLMKSMQDAADPDFFGMCAKCGQSIMGESTGCTALDQLFHINCFTCVSCDACLRGQPFYAMEGKPYCEACYLNTLEKCSVCSKVITDRVLRATGKPYHPDCFTCLVCGKNLDGVPFTVDATSQIHCIQDFHRKFAPRCCVCGDPIIPSENSSENVRIVALDRSFHVSCYKCEDCGLVLSSTEEGRGCYPLDDHILCCSCNAQRINALTTKMTTEL